MAMKNMNQPILNAGSIKCRVKGEDNLDVSLLQVQKVLKQDLKYSYRRSRKVPLQGNSERCLVLRQQYA